METGSFERKVDFTSETRLSSGPFATNSGREVRFRSRITRSATSVVSRNSEAPSSTDTLVRPPPTSWMDTGPLVDSNDTDEVASYTGVVRSPMTSAASAASTTGTSRCRRSRTISRQ